MKLFVAQKSSSGGLFHSPPPLTYSVWNSRGGWVCVCGGGGGGEMSLGIPVIEQMQT